MMQAKVGAFAQNKFTNAIQQSTISLTWFRSGVGDPPKINVIPSVAEAGLDCRVLPGTTQGSVDRRGRRGASAIPRIKIELINESDDPVVTSQDAPLYRNIEAAIKRRHPEAIVTPILIPYGTDSNAFRPQGREELRHLPRAAPGRRRRLDARRRRARAASRACAKERRSSSRRCAIRWRNERSDGTAEFAEHAEKKMFLCGSLRSRCGFFWT